MPELERLAHIGTWQWDLDADRVSWSAGLAEIYGVAPEDAPASFAAYVALLEPADAEIVRTVAEQSLITGEPLESHFRIRRADGETRWLLCRAHLTTDGSGRRYMVGACQDVTDQKTAEAALTTLALHDSLTGLPERTLFIDRTNQAIHRITRASELLAVMFLDLDRFKAINDTLGHMMGDQVLLQVAVRLQSILRPGDTVARVGGDEFAILCEGLKASSAEALARRIVDVVREPIVVDGRVAVTGASVGVAVSSDAGSTAEAMLRDADAAMYAAKEAGRGCVVVFDDAARVRDFERMRRRDELRIGLNANELRVHYQPEVDLATGAVGGVEALVRWEHPSLGLLAPDAFIGVAESTGLVVPLGEYVLGMATADVAALSRDMVGMPMHVAVNLSAAQLAEPKLLDSVVHALETSGLPADQLCLEITESVLMDDVDSSIAALWELKALGVRLAIDDFGTGYSSLSYLRRFPVDVVKIDRSFINAVGIDAAADAIVAAVVQLSHALGLLVVAEGIETDAQLVAIRALGVDRAQGYYWSPALPLDELAQWADASRERLSSEPIGISELLAERIDALRTATGRFVVTEVPSRVGGVMADRRSLQTLFDHLLGNAVTYSPSDRPVVVTAASDRHWIRVSVADYGIGMSRDESARCFEQFWQAPEAATNGARGTGIGLYIVRSLVEAMGGHVAVRSARGKGSTFTVALPRSTRAVPAARRMPGRPTSVGEDSSIREFMRQLGVPTRRGA